MQTHSKCIMYYYVCPPLQATVDQRRLAVDLAEVIIKWEFQRAREAQEMEVGTV